MEDAAERRLKTYVDEEIYKVREMVVDILGRLEKIEVALESRDFDVGADPNVFEEEKQPSGVLQIVPAHIQLSIVEAVKSSALAVKREVFEEINRTIVPAINYVNEGVNFANYSGEEAIDTFRRSVMARDDSVLAIQDARRDPRHLGPAQAPASVQVVFDEDNHD